MLNFKVEKASGYILKTFFLFILLFVFYFFCFNCYAFDNLCLMLLHTGGGGQIFTVPDHDGGRPKQINAWFLYTHMVYL